MVNSSRGKSTTSAPLAPRGGEGDDADVSVLPLFRRFPALERLPRAPLGEYPTPVERMTGIDAAGELWLKRDDLDAPAFGGNKVRALEFLLGGVCAGDQVLTIGGEGSTHVLTTAALAGRLGARTRAIRWPHEL